MLVEPPIEKLLPQVENRFDLSILVAKRNRELIDGAEPMVKGGENESLVSIACREIADNQVVAVAGEVEATVPLRESLVTEVVTEREEDTDADDWQSEGPELEDELVPTPVSKLKVMSEDDIFEIPEEEIDEEDDEVPVKSKKREAVEEDDDYSDEDEDDDEEEDDEDAEYFDIEDDDFELLDSSIDDYMDEEEDEDFLSNFENYEYDEDDM